MDKEKYLLHSNLSVFKRHVKETKKIIAEALEKGVVWAVSCSGGKDSTALLDLCYQVGWRGPIFHFYYSETPTENTELVRKLANKYKLELHILKVPGAWEVYDKVGHFFVYPETEEEKQAVNEMLKKYKEKSNQYIKKQGWQGQFMGMRKQESKQRAMMLSKKGAIYKTKTRETLTCCPLLNWNNRDVWAYILTNNLDYLDRYENMPEERSETTWLAAEGLWRHGMAARLRKEDQKKFNQLANKYPKIKCFV